MKSLIAFLASLLLVQTASANLPVEQSFRRYQLGIVRADLVRTNHSGKNVELEFLVSTCITDNLTGKPVTPGTNVAIEIDSRNQSIAVTVSGKEGCIAFIDKLNLSADSLLPKETDGVDFSRIQILSYGLSINNIKSSIGIMVNPLDDKFTFGRDLRVLDSKILREILKQNAKTQ